MIFTADDNDYKRIEELKKEGKYVFATCYDIEWGFILPCESGVVWEQQTDGVCCHHVFIEGILIPLGHVMDYSDKDYHNWYHILPKIVDLNYNPGRNHNLYKKELKRLWGLVKECSHIDFEFIDAPHFPDNQEAFQWVIYHGHEEGYGQSFSIESWKEKPIVLVYPNCD
jgi:hypothetical protein